MKKTLFLCLFTLIGYISYGQTTEVAVSDTTAPTRNSRAAFKVASNNTPYLVRKGWLPRQLALYSDLAGYGNGVYVSISGSYNNPTWLASLAATKITGLATVATTGSYPDLTNKPTTLAGYGITDADPYTTVATYAAMNALTYSANTTRRVLVQADEVYGKSNQWYQVWADGSGVMHADKIVTITEK